MLMTDETASQVWEGEYLPFGEVYSVTGSVDNNLRFPGQYYDAETGLHYNYFRDYKPVIGRYVEADPIGLLGGLNLYAYVVNNPVNFVDPWGLLAYFPWHEGITYVAARNSGYSVMDSLSLAMNTAAVDFSGTQGKNSADTVQHAMAASVGQTSAEAIAATNVYIQSSINIGNLPGAIHATQDLATPLHAGQPWHGFNWLEWETYKHILGDVFPSWGTIKQAYQNTKGILNPKGCSK
jgi:RHS repeat-associated protein